MFKKIFSTIGGKPTEKDLQRYSEVADQIIARGPEIERLSEAELRAKTDEFRAQIQAARAGLENDEAVRAAENRVLDEILIEAFAVVREAAVRAIGLRHYAVQLTGGQVLHEGRVAEMRTGEGKTLVATLPFYLNALTGRGVHLVTVNDYLARRDAKWMGPIYRLLGMEVGILQDASRTEHARKAFMYDPERESPQEDNNQMRSVLRREAYLADITYGTNNEFGFDYLRDNMANSLSERRQVELNYSIIDEVDNVLIDSARTPLIISGPAQFDTQMYGELARVAKQMRPELFEIDERGRTIALTEEGYDRAEELIGRPLRDPDNPEDITPEQAQLQGFLEQAMRAEFLFKRNKDYLVQAGNVHIVDTFTGRVMPGRRWSDGLHQAIEAKEGMRIQAENVTYATITLQNFFRLYSKLAGMSGTAVTESEEFDKIYSLAVVPIPTNLDYRAVRDPELEEIEYKENGYKFSYVARKDDPETPILWRRKDYDDLVYRSEEAKLRAIVQEIVAMHAVGRPLLIGTTSVDGSEYLSGRLRAELLRKLALVWLLRDYWFEANDQQEDGRAVAELTFLNKPLTTIKPADMRPMAKELGLKLNPTEPQNLKRLAQIIGVPQTAINRLEGILDGGIPHQVLNAKKHDEESQIIAHAGKLGAVTIATNMAGRGVDIKLGGDITEETLNQVNRVLGRESVADPFDMTNEERAEALQQLDPEQYGIYSEEVEAYLTHLEDERTVRAQGGLHVISSERHEARRIDNQLRGRAGRQGDPGSSRFYLSLEDELMRRFGGQNVSGLMERLKIDEMLPIEHGLVNKSIEQSQTRVEGANFDVRKHLLEYDDVLNDQRNKFYDQRNLIFSKEDPSDDLQEMLASETQRRVELAAMEEDGWWKLLSWLNSTQPTLQRLDGLLLFSFSIELLLDEIGAQLPALADGWQTHKAAIEGSQTAGHDPAAVKAAADEARNHLQQATEQLPQIKETLLDIAAHSAAAARERLIASIETQLETLSTHASERGRYKRELAEMAYEGALNEAREYGRPIQVRTVAKDMFETATIQSSLSKSELQALTPDNVQTEVAQRVEALAGNDFLQRALKRIAVRSRLEIDLETPAWEDLDWDALIYTVLYKLEAAHIAQTERHLREIEGILENRIKRPEQLTRDAMGRLVLDMAYSQDVQIDQRTKQRQVRLQQRFPYVYFAGRLLDGVEPEELTERILVHLQTATDIQRVSWGEAELQRLSTAQVADLDAETQKWLQSKLAAEDSAAIAGQKLGTIEASLRDSLRDALGKRIAVGAHRQLMISISGQLWVDYLTEIEGIRTSIGLEAYAQRDPLLAYKRRAYEQFRQLLTDMRAGVVSRLFTFQPRNLDELRSDIERSAPAEQQTHKTPGRNEPCWCGSGKKYKNCHLRTEQGQQGNGAAAARPPKPRKAKKKKKSKKQRQR